MEAEKSSPKASMGPEELFFVLMHGGREELVEGVDGAWSLIQLTLSDKELEGGVDGHTWTFANVISSLGKAWDLHLMY
jgi:hypothetical protein